jgi:hypothetical protein
VSKDLTTTLPDDPDPGSPDDWVSAADTIRIVRTVTMSPSSEVTILTRAFAGLIRTRAALLTMGDRSETDFEIPTVFWWAKGYAAIQQNWQVGDFATTSGSRGGPSVQAYGVRFHRAGLEEMLPGAFGIPASKTADPPKKESAGRPMSPLWRDWIAELVADVHDNGFPAGSGGKGTDELIRRVADGLAERGLEGPSRSTVQETIGAVLRRGRPAGNST